MLVQPFTKVDGPEVDLTHLICFGEVQLVDPVQSGTGGDRHARHSSLDGASKMPLFVETHPHRVGVASGVDDLGDDLDPSTAAPAR